VLRDRDRGAQDDKKQGLRTTEGCHPEIGGMAEGSGVSFWTSILLSLNAEVLKHPVWTHFKSQPGSFAAAQDDRKRYSLLWDAPSASLGCCAIAIRRKAHRQDDRQGH